MKGRCPVCRRKREIKATPYTDWYFDPIYACDRCRRILDKHMMKKKEQQQK